MLEIKCPSSRVIDGIIPTGYYCQVQMQLEVCELDRCDFLECRIKEYDSEEDYLNDNYSGNNFYNSIGFEKGVVVEYFIIAEKKYKFDYSPIGIMGAELEIWKTNARNKYDEINDGSIVFSSFSYWYLEKVSCIPIYRNQEWFNNVYPELEKCWNDIIYYRSLENGLFVLKNDIQYLKDQKKDEKLEEKLLTKKTVEKKPSAKRAKKDATNITMLDFIEKNKDISIVAEPKDEYYEDNNIINKGICLFSEEDDNSSISNTNSMNTDYNYDYENDNKSVNFSLFSD
jgi:hypothetical protein